MRGNPQQVLEAIDEYGRTRKYLMNVGDHKSTIVVDLIRKEKPQVIVELGGYVGYSAIAFAAALRDANKEKGEQGQYFSIEKNPEFAAVVAMLVGLAGLQDIVTVVVGSGSEALRRLHGQRVLGHIDLLFLDHYKPAYTDDLKLCEDLGLVGPGSIYVADNVVKPGNLPYLEYARSTVDQKRQRLKTRWEPSGVPDALEVIRCVGISVPGSSPSSSSSSSRHAYATLITRASYLPGVVILAHTLQKHKTQHPLIVLCTSGVSPDATRALELETVASLKDNNSFQLILHPCEPLMPTVSTSKLIASRFQDTWTKLRVFSLSPDAYDTICFLDADTAMFKNMGAVFHYSDHLPPEEPHIVANHACVCNLDSDAWAPQDWTPANCAYTPLRHPTALTEPTQPTPNGPATHRLNSGAFLLRPDSAVWQDILPYFQPDTDSEPSPTKLDLGNFLFPDQDFLTHFFKNKWSAFGWQFNTLKTMRYWHPDMWRDDEVVCLHFIVDKPWTRRVGADGSRGIGGSMGLRTLGGGSYMRSGRRGPNKRGKGWRL
ncbi:S-adenosyl-L-methionine-dependent methyltransferase [Rhypophila sp. PSN 637]